MIQWSAWYLVITGGFMIDDIASIFFSAFFFYHQLTVLPGSFLRMLRAVVFFSLPANY